MTVKQLLLYYLDVYKGEQQGAFKRTEEELERSPENGGQADIRNKIHNALDELKSEGAISVMPYNEMDIYQKSAFDKEGKIFYKLSKPES